MQLRSSSKLAAFGARSRRVERRQRRRSTLARDPMPEADRRPRYLRKCACRPWLARGGAIESVRRTRLVVQEFCVSVSNPQPLEVEFDGEDRIWSHVRNRWLMLTPEEAVRQEYLTILVNHYGWQIKQISEEVSVTGRGSAQARADFVIWRRLEDRTHGRPPLIVVECKSDNVRISPQDYSQGDNYARLSNASFVVTHNNRETRFWRVLRDRMPGYLEEIEDIPTTDASDTRIRYLLENLKTFREDEFAALLGLCHNVIRDREHLDPAAAFDEIAKILFLKTTFERRLREGQSQRNLFTADFLEEQAEFQRDPINSLFADVKEYYKSTGIFSVGSKIALRESTSLEIVRLLERYNLSDTSEDVKGIAFERFLGRTFRGEIGQFFTPRPVVRLITAMIDATEGQRLLDPASGSGGFLIQAFQMVREKIAAATDTQYQEFRVQHPNASAEVLAKRYDEFSHELNAAARGTKAWKLANWAVNGVDANNRMARTSKMNMIMHGDGHGGIHHANGLLDVGTVIAGQFDVIMTNPPFGSDVPRGSLVHSEDVARDADSETDLRALLGPNYTEYKRELNATVGKSILDLFDLSRGQGSSVKTEVLFVERCLNLLRPGGQLAIVLPEGLLSNPTSEYIREHCEMRAYLRAVVSLPKETFKSTSADVRTSVVILQRFTEKEQSRHDELLLKCGLEARASLASSLDTSLASVAPTNERLRRRVHDAHEQEVATAAKRHYWEHRTESVFMYEAQHVGITATGEPTTNELYPNAHQPVGVSTTCLDKWNQFRAGQLDSQSAELLAARGFAIPRSHMARWDLKSARAAEFRRQHPEYLPLSTYLEDATELVRPSSAPTEEWNVYGVSNAVGIFLASSVPGSEIKQSYKRIQQGWFFHNPTRANVGSLGRVGDVLKNAVTSPEYQIWRVKDGAGLLPEFVEVMLKTDYFLRLVAVHRRGAVKERLYLENLLEIVIPPLSEDEQHRVVKSWQAAQAKLRAARQSLVEVVEDLDSALS